MAKRIIAAAFCYNKYFLRYSFNKDNTLVPIYVYSCIKADEKHNPFCEMLTIQIVKVLSGMTFGFNNSFPALLPYYTEQRVDLKYVRPCFFCHVSFKIIFFYPCIVISCLFVPGLWIFFFCNCNCFITIL